MVKKGTILVVDDEKVNRLILKKMLEDRYDILEASNGKEAFQIFEEQYGYIMAVILDVVMPMGSGLDFLELYHKSEYYKKIPVLVATIEDGTNTEKKCLQLGAWDFTKKPYDADILRFRLENVIERSQFKEAKELKYMKEYSALTGIYNKKRFFEEVRRILVQNPEKDYAFLRFDIEKFQLVNSFYGVEEGDKLLQFLANYIERKAETYSTKAYGHLEADVFGMCIPYQKKEELISIADEVRKILSEYPLEFDIVPACGIYLIVDKTLSVNDMYDMASLASKYCKGNYMYYYSFYSDTMSVDVIKEQIIINSMKHALESGQFQLYIQPKYELRKSDVDGGEVLIRWNDPQRGMISPGEFIPVFERNGFIVKLDYFVWETTCKLLRKWLDEGKKPYPLSVNISRVSLYNPKLVEIITGLTERYQIAPELLQLELTESAYTSNQTAIRETMEKFREKGFTILMDDFGSGYSSLNVLKDIVVDILKIDMKFLSDTDEKGRSENILASVVRMAKWLNMPVIAEGVEKESQVLFLKSIGCEYVQGYYFGKPMPVEEYEKLVFQKAEGKSTKHKEKKYDMDSLWTATSQMENLFSNMMQAMAIYEFDEETSTVEILRVNTAYYELLGYNDVYRRYDMGVIQEEYRSDFLKAFHDVVKNQDVTECEVVRYTESGRRIWAHMKLKYITPVGMNHVLMGTIIDVTEQKEIDKELMRYRTVIAESLEEVPTILIVDDLEINRSALRCIFEENYRILEAANGKEAFEILMKNQNKVDMILLDLQMPVMDGPTFLKQKNKQMELAGIPVVIITSDDDTEHQVEILELGANDYIVKPFIPEIVSRRVENVLESRIQRGKFIREKLEI
ncbi:MAG: EAL domain-containing protein [Roseburia sp.]